MALDAAGVLAWVDDWTRRQFGGSINDTFTGHSAADWVVLGEYAPPALREQIDAPLRDVARAAGLPADFNWWPYLAATARTHWERFGQPFRYLESPAGYLVEGAAGLAAQDFPQLAPVAQRVTDSDFLEQTIAQQGQRLDAHKSVNRSLNWTIALAALGGWIGAGALGGEAGAGAAAEGAAGAGAAAGAEGGAVLADYIALEEGLAAYTEIGAPLAAVAEAAPWYEPWVDTGTDLLKKWAGSRIAASLAPDVAAPPARSMPGAGVQFFPVGGQRGDALGSLLSPAAQRNLVIFGGLALVAIVAVKVLNK